MIRIHVGPGLRLGTYIRRANVVEEIQHPDPQSYEGQKPEVQESGEEAAPWGRPGKEVSQDRLRLAGLY